MFSYFVFVYVRACFDCVCLCGMTMVCLFWEVSIGTWNYNVFLLGCTCSAVRILSMTEILACNLFYCN